MASIRREIDRGREGYRLRYYWQKKQRSVWLGDLTESQAATWLEHINHLLWSHKNGTPPAKATAGWLSGLSDDLHDRLAPIVEPRNRASKVTLDAFVTSQLDAMKSELKGSSQIVYGNVKANLIEHFGASRDMATITPQDARDFKKWLEESANRKTEGTALAANTVRKRTGVCKTLFDAAIEEGLIVRNPFAKLPSSVRPNADREHYVTMEDFAKLLKHVPDSDWRLLLMLARIESLRIPSEAVTLQWEHIDFKAKQLLIYATKTERKKPIRVAPLLPIVEAAMKPSTGKVFPWLTEETNLRTQLLKYIKRAGLEPWPRLWQNLRVSAATDFARIVPAHVAARICGHTVQIARLFYWQVTDSDISEAREKFGGLTGGLNLLSDSFRLLHDSNGPDGARNDENA